MPHKVETIQEKARRLNALVGLGLPTGSPAETAMCRIVAIAQAEALEEAAKLQSFPMTLDGDSVVLSQDLLNMARDLRESVK